jgi:hypothetical protein
LNSKKRGFAVWQTTHIHPIRMRCCAAIGLTAHGFVMAQELS